MPKVLIALALVVAAAAVYAVSPLYAAWTLKEAIRTNDVATLERRVAWPEVRASLRQSLLAETAIATDLMGEGAPLPKPTLWQRVKAAFAPTMIDGFLDRYLTPSGLPQLFSARASYNANIRGLPDERAEAWHQRAASLWSRVRRIVIKGPTALEVEIADRHSPERRYVSVMEMRGLEWKLVSLQIVTVSERAGAGAGPRATRAADAR